jgi:hypothetical protein
MVQIAQTSFNEQPVDILYPNFKHNTKTNSILTFTSEEDSFYYHHTAFYYKNRARLHFNVTNKFLAYYGLIKGLIAFNKPGELKFNFPAGQKLMVIDLDVNQFEALNKLFRTVYAALLKEVQFRAELKKAIAFEQRYRREVAELYLAVG